MNFQPMGNKLLLKRAEAENKTKSGLYLAPVAQEKSTIAEVVAVGPGQDFWDNQKNCMVTVPPKFKEGDVVLLPKFGVADITVDGVEYVLLNATEVLGKFNE